MSLPPGGSGGVYDKKSEKKKEKEWKELAKEQEKQLKKQEKYKEKDIKKQEKDFKKMSKHGVPPGHMAHAQPIAGAMAYNVDPQVAQWFGAVDQDRSGRITSTELQAALQNSNGQKFSEAACRLMIGMFDGGSGSIDINGFSHLFTYVNQWLNAFRTYDRDQSGFISSQELMSALQTMGYRFTQPFADMLAARFGDKRGAGLPVDGFIMSCILIQKFTESFRRKDAQQQGVITIAYEDFLTMILQAWA